jgi:hypothetical protein
VPPLPAGGCLAYQIIGSPTAASAACTSLLGSANCAPPNLVELHLSRSARLGIAILEGSCVNEPLEERDDLCTNMIRVAFFLVELRELVLEDFVETAAFTVTLRHAGDDPRA